MNKTKIEWTDYTWNPVTGCKAGCPYCYARNIANRFKGTKAFPNGFEPTFHEDRLYEPLAAPDGSKIFTCSMGELFGDWLPEWQVKQVFDVIRMKPEHTFQLLTKQPQSLKKWIPFPDNCWVGVSAPTLDAFCNAWFYIKDIKAKVKFISLEPLLDWECEYRDFKWALETAEINWLIIGQQTPVSAKTQPKIEWVKEILDAADKAGVPVFLKNNLTPLFWVNGVKDHIFFPPWATARGVYRQEFPNLNEIK